MVPSSNCFCQVIQNQAFIFGGLIGGSKMDNEIMIYSISSQILSLKFLKSFLEDNYYETIEMDFVKLKGKFLLYPYGDKIIFGRGFKLFNVDKSKLIFTNIFKRLGPKKKPEPKKIATQIQNLKQFYREKPLLI